MKTSLHVFATLILFATTIFAQNSNLEMRIEKIQNTDNWEFNLQYNFENSTDTGIFIELPTNFKVTPVSININNEEMWLKNSSESTDNDSVIHWETVENGLILRFNDDLIQPASQLSLKCISQISSKLPDDINVPIKKILDNDQIGNELIVSGNLNITQ